MPGRASVKRRNRRAKTSRHVVYMALWPISRLVDGEHCGNLINIHYTATLHVEASALERHKLNDSRPRSRCMR